MIKVSDFKKDLCIFCSSISAFNNIARKDNTLNLPIRILDNCIRKIDEFDFKDKDLDFISKQFDIKNKIYKEYDSNWKNKGDELLELDLLQVFAGFLFLRVLLAKGNPNEARTLKYINVCWKIFDSIELPDFLQEAKTCLNKIQDELFEHISSKNKYSEEKINGYVVYRTKFISELFSPKISYNKSLSSASAVGSSSINLSLFKVLFKMFFELLVNSLLLKFLFVKLIIMGAA